MTIVPFSGELDIVRYPVFHQAFAKVLELPRPVILDLMRVSRVDSTFLTELLILVRRREAAGQPTVIAIAHPTVVRLITVAELQYRLALTTSIAEAASLLEAIDSEAGALEA